MQYEFKSTWWLQYYWPHIEPLYRVEGHYGTRWSAKSHNIARKLIYHSFKSKRFNVIHSRKVYGDIEGSTFKLLTDLIYKHFPNDFTIKKDHFQIINKHTGNWFRGLGMDNPEKAKGVEGANIAWLEEVNQYTEEDFDFINTTIRGGDGVDISMIMCWNPESINHWLYKQVENNQNSPGHLYLKSTFWNNYTIDRNSFHETLLKIKSKGQEGEKRYKVWANGDWGIEDMDKTFSHSFDVTKHVVKGKILTVPELPIILSFDFNVTNTCGVQQFSKNGPGAKYYATINRIKTYRIGDLRSLCQTIKAEFPNRFFIINGDASGQNRSAFTSDNISAYQQIQHELKVSDRQFVIPSVNPSHIQSRVVTNIVYQRCLVQIAEEDNLDLINDNKEAQVDRKGSLDPWKTKNPNKGHAFDEWRYFLFTNFGEIQKEYEL